MARKDRVVVNFRKDSVNHNFNSEVLYVQGKRAEIKKGVNVEIPKVYADIIDEAEDNYRKFATSNDKISENDEIRRSL